MDMATLQAWLPTVIAGGALALIWNDMRNTKRQLMERVEAVSNTLKKALYRDDGQTNYMPRATCERERDHCQQTTCGKIEAIVGKMELMDTRREHAKEQLSREMGDIKQGLAVLTERVEQLSEDIIKN